MADGSKAKFIRDLLDRALETKVPQITPEEFERDFGIRATAEEIKSFTFAEIMVRQLVVKAASGNDRSIQEILDRLLGKPMQQTESVVKSYSYHDFLLQCKDLDDDEKIPKRIVADPVYTPNIPAVLDIPHDRPKKNLFGRGKKVEKNHDPAEDLI